MKSNATASYGVLVLRLSLGVMFVAHGLQKIMVFTLPGTAQFFQSVGFPGFLGYVVAIAELGGGIFLILGVYTRWVALALMPILLGAAWVHWGNGWAFSAPNGGWEYPVYLAVSVFAFFLMGDGPYALRPSKN